MMEIQSESWKLEVMIILSKSLEIHTKTHHKSPALHSHSNLKQIPIRQIHSVKHRNTTILFLSIPTIQLIQRNPSPALHPHNPIQSPKYSYIHISISLQQLKIQSALHSTHNHPNSNKSSPITISIPSLTIPIHYLPPIPTTCPNHTPFHQSSPSSPYSHQQTNTNHISPPLNPLQRIHPPHT